MIVVKLIGGLGNQMFQYAAGRALALHHGTDLFLDTTALMKDPAGAYTPRNYELGAFQIKAQIADKHLLNYFETNARIKNKIKSYFPFFSRSLVFNESGRSFDRRFFKLPASTYLNGYWQDPAYFSHISGILREEFSVKQKTLPYSSISYYVSTLNSVSIHIRRGDYVSLGAASAFHGVLSLDYYRQAVERIIKLHKDPVFMVFSDDLKWCEENLGFIPNVNFVDGTDTSLKPQEELLIMSSCRHNIIANSSFSWWAAWLNAGENKTVIAPKLWFKGSEQQPSELFPPDWIRL